MDNTRGFKIDLNAIDTDDEKIPAKPKRKKRKPLKKKDSRSPMLVILFAIVVFGVILVWTYYHLNKKIMLINTEGSSGIANLSVEFNNKTSVLSQQVSDEKAATQKILSGINDQLKVLNATVVSFQNSKMDKKALESSINSITESIKPLQKKIAKLNDQVENSNKETAQINTTLKKIQTGVLNNTRDISTLDAIHIDQAYFDKELKKEREFHQQNMAHASEALFSEIAGLRERIQELEKALGKTANMSDSQSRKTKTPSDNISTPKPGEIIEQEIE